MPLSRRTLLTLFRRYTWLPAAVCAQLPIRSERKTESRGYVPLPAMPGEVQAYIEETAAAKISFLSPVPEEVPAGYVFRPRGSADDAPEARWKPNVLKLRSMTGGSISTGWSESPD